MRILLWYWGRKGAGGQLTLLLAQGLRQRADVEVALSLSAQADLLPDLAELGLPMDVVSTYGSAVGFAAGLLRVPSLSRRLRRQALAFRADAVVSVMTHLWTPLIAPGLKRAGIGYVPMVHDAEPHPGDRGAFWEWRLTRELDAAAGVIAFSDNVAAGVARRRPTLPVHRLELGALLQRGGGTAPRAADDTLRFVNIGRLRTYKGIDLLRDAWPMVAARRPDARLLVAGEGDAEALAPGLGALPGVEVHARWLSEAEMAGMVARADVVVLPYREASQSGVAPLAHGLGVPVVATPVGGLTEQVRDGIDGLLARDVTAAALAGAMLAAGEASTLARLAAGAREAALRLNDWEITCDDLVRVLRTIVEGGAAAT